MSNTVRIILALWVIATFSISSNAEVLSCKKNGKVIFTDNKRNCDSEVTRVNIQKSEDSRKNYRYPQRQYQDRSSRYTIFVESPESEKDKVQLDLAVERLNTSLNYVFSKLPLQSHVYLKKISFYIMLGPDSKLGGEDNGLRYFPTTGDPSLLLGDKRWTHSVVVYNVYNFNWLTELWVNKVVVHELSHSWHYFDWGTNYPILKETWLSSRQKGLYLSQRDIKGKLLKPAYATTNEREYFSELSATYFVGGDYFPFNKAELKKYDPQGYAMVERVWGI